MATTATERCHELEHINKRLQDDIHSLQRNIDKADLTVLATFKSRETLEVQNHQLESSLKDFATIVSRYLQGQDQVAHKAFIDILDTYLDILGLSRATRNDSGVHVSLLYYLLLPWGLTVIQAAETTHKSNEPSITQPTLSTTSLESPAAATSPSSTLCTSGTDDSPLIEPDSALPVVNVGPNPIGLGLTGIPTADAPPPPNFDPDDPNADHPFGSAPYPITLITLDDLTRHDGLFAWLKRGGVPTGYRRLHKLYPYLVGQSWGDILAFHTDAQLTKFLEQSRLLPGGRSLPDITLGARTKFLRDVKLLRELREEAWLISEI